ncbi:ORF55 [Duck aviadenovirus B]|uniref:ORF55 n=1 Tax=Duck aviadenovirus B TaxID=1534553 RepID=A0A7D5BLU2_9ADEN|nr:ORF55 [Duck aviadenovirus B]UZT48547.1 ORF55 [Duck adenovirus 3]
MNSALIVFLALCTVSVSAQVSASSLIYVYENDNVTIDCSSLSNSPFFCRSKYFWVTSKSVGITSDLGGGKFFIANISSSKTDTPIIRCRCGESVFADVTIQIQKLPTNSSSIPASIPVSPSPHQDCDISWFYYMSLSFILSEFIIVIFVLIKYK